MTLKESEKALQISDTTFRKYFILSNMGETKYIGSMNFSKKDLYKIAKLIDSVHFAKDKEHLLDLFFQKKKTEIIKTKEEKLQEMRKLHPLVTDDRFFEVTYFPDVDDYEFLTECNTRGKK